MNLSICKRIIYAILFLWILLSNIFTNFIPGINYWDECITIIALIYTMFRFNSKNKICNEIIILLFIMITIGIMGNITFGFQTNKIAILKDIIAFIKFPIIAVACIIRKNNTYTIDDLSLKDAFNISKIYVIVVSFFGVVSLFKNIGMSWDYRAGILSYKFLYTHPTFLAYALVITSVVLVAYPKQGIDKNILIILNLFSLFMTMRNKAFTYIVFFIVVVYLIPHIRFNKIKIRYFLLPLALAIVISKDKIINYLNFSWSPREALYTCGYQLMKQCFPIGSGFGSFASSVSGEYYSNAYYTFGLNLKPGMSPSDFIDLGDAGIPYYYACFGLLGVLVFVLILYLIFKKAIFYYSYDVHKYQAAILLMIYIVTSLPFEATLTNESGASVGIIMFLFIGNSFRQFKMCGNKLN